jgi:hypothetical protein
MGFFDVRWTPGTDGRQGGACCIDQAQAHCVHAHMIADTHHVVAVVEVDGGGQV